MYGLQKEKGGFGLKFPLICIKEKGFMELILRYDLGVIWSDFVVLMIVNTYAHITKHAIIQTLLTLSSKHYEDSS